MISPGESSTAALKRAISSSDICIRLRLLAKSNTAFTRSSQPGVKEEENKVISKSRTTGGDNLTKMKQNKSALPRFIELVY